MLSPLLQSPPLPSAKFTLEEELKSAAPQSVPLNVIQILIQLSSSTDKAVFFLLLNKAENELKMILKQTHQLPSMM